MPNRRERRHPRKGGVILDQDKPAAPVKLKIISLGYPYTEDRGVSARWHQAVLQFVASAAKAGYAIRELPAESPSPTDARNQILRRFLEFEDSHLLLSDPNIVFTPEDVGLLLAADSAIAGAYYITAASGQAPWATALVEGDDGLVPITLPELDPQPQSADFEDVKEYEAAVGAWIPGYMSATQPVEVAAVGTGLMLIRREVVKDVLATYEQPFERVGDVDDGATFCQRAREADHKVMLVPQAHVGHLKTLELR